MMKAAFGDMLIGLLFVFDCLGKDETRHALNGLYTMHICEFACSFGNVLLNILSKSLKRFQGTGMLMVFKHYLKE